jgi:hypothetical protein
MLKLRFLSISAAPFLIGWGCGRHVVIAEGRVGVVFRNGSRSEPSMEMPLVARLTPPYPLPPSNPRRMIPPN